VIAISITDVFVSGRYCYAPRYS